MHAQRTSPVPPQVLDEIVSDSDHREFISAGTAAGISSAFGAPVGGVLFAMEEACSFWSRKTAWRCFMAAVFATFTMAQINKGCAAAAAAAVTAPGLLSTDGCTRLMSVRAG
jgi:H+/Cl- antiporter ClcA